MSNNLDSLPSLEATASPASSENASHSPHTLEQHNKRLSMVSGVPAQVSIDSPDVHVSLVQPGDLMKTPLADEVQAPRQVHAAVAERHGPAAGFAADYFSTVSTDPPMVPLNEHSPVEASAQTNLSRQTTRSSEQPGRDNPEHFHMESSLEHRLAAQRQSIAAASTTFANSSNDDQGPETRGLRPRRSLTEHPQYPNQSLAALSSQVYPENHRAPYSSRPEVSRFHASRPASLQSHISSPANSGDERQSRTVGNTPIQSPGLFSPRVSRYHPLPSAGAESPIPSPYLHPVQPQAPKETNKALRDVDTQSGRKTINEYEILFEIGKGTHGKVKLARSSLSGVYVAIKIVQRYSKRRRLGKAQSQEDKVKKEIAILKKAMHPNLVGMVEVIDDPDLHKIYLVLEFCEAHDVKWREYGTSDIVLLESQRLKREQEGVSELDSPEADSLTRAARRRQERALNHHRPPLSRINSESEFWSLEYGANSEPDEDDRASNFDVSRMSSHGDRHQPAAVPVGVEDVDNTPGPSVSSEHSGGGRVLPSPEHIVVHESPQHHSWNLQEFQAEMQERVENAGDYEGERTRQVSLADSSSSKVTDLMEHSLTDDLRYVPLLTVPESRRAFRDALLGLEYLHYQGIIHRDIKPENLLRKADLRVKISDFGVSYLGKPIRDGRESEDTSDAEGSGYHEVETELAKTVGTPAFYAPELCDLNFTEDKPRVTGQIDVWALGVTLYCFIFARLPFQAEGTFEMMKRIAEDEISISRKRLKALDIPAGSRSDSHTPQIRVSKDHRMPHELLYDAIDDDLYDLLQRLLIKDPTQRITVREIKHHPWVLRDIPDKAKWLDETDPGRFHQGRKIEISPEEIHEAVAPLRLVERVKSVAKKAFGLTGFGGGSRKRGQSTAISTDVNSISPVSHPLHSPSGVQTHSRSDDSITAALRSSREQQHHQSHPEHPLSQSVTASPELSTADSKGFDLPGSYKDAPDPSYPNEHGEQRPVMPDRQGSVLSTADSVRTIRQSDFASSHTAEVPAHVEQHPERFSNQLFGILGDAGRNILRTVRSRDRNTPEGRSPSSSAASSQSPEAHDHLQAQPSVAVSSTSASGQLTHGGDVAQSPEALYRNLPSAGLASHRDEIAADKARVHGHEQTTLPARAARLAQTPSFLQLSASNADQGRVARRPAPSSHSSQDHLNPGISRETSFPSVPSVVSASSSVVPDRGVDASPKVQPKSGPVASVESMTSPVSASAMSSVSLRPLKLTSSDDIRSEEVETDEDDSDSDDDFLAMKRTKSKAMDTPKASARGGSSSQ